MLLGYAGVDGYFRYAASHHYRIRRKDGAKPTAVSRQRLYVPALSSPLFVRKLERVPPFGGPRGYRSGAIPPDLSCLTRVYLEMGCILTLKDGKVNKTYA